MATLALALPCLPGGSDKLRSLAEACRGERRPEFEDFYRRVGLSAEHWFLQQTPEGSCSSSLWKVTRWVQWPSSVLRTTHSTVGSKTEPLRSTVWISVSLCRGPPPAEVFAG
jgi:hypothetical protein